MPIVDRLERKIGWIAIRGIVRILAGFQLLTYVLAQFNDAIFEVLMLDPGRIVQGEVWRLVSFVFLLPVGLSPLLVLFALWFMFFLGEILEALWGSFRLTLYLMGAVGALVLAGFIAYYLVGDLGRFVTRIHGELTGNEFYTFMFATRSTGLIWVTTILFAAAVLQPGLQINLLGVIPIKLYWLAIFDAGVLLIDFLQLTRAHPLLGLCLLISIGNFLIVFGPSSYRLMRQRGEVAVRRRKFEMAKMPENESLHRCAVCQKTEHDDPDLEFRVAADGEEYCVDHLPGAGAD